MTSTTGGFSWLRDGGGGGTSLGNAAELDAFAFPTSVPFEAFWLVDVNVPVMPVISVSTFATAGVVPTAAIGSTGAFGKLNGGLGADILGFTWPPQDLVDVVSTFLILFNLCGKSATL